VDGLVRLMNSGDEVTGPMNLGNPGEFTVRELAEKVIALTGSRVQIRREPLPGDDPVRRCPDISLARRLLKWEPKVDLDAGLRRTIDYFDRLLSRTGPGG
jgi:UDP-glucuronate decarboxylase